MWRNKRGRKTERGAVSHLKHEATWERDTTPALMKSQSMLIILFPYSNFKSLLRPFYWAHFFLYKLSSFPFLSPESRLSIGFSVVFLSFRILKILQTPSILSGGKSFCSGNSAECSAPIFTGRQLIINISLIVAFKAKSVFEVHWTPCNLLVDVFFKIR